MHTACMLITILSNICIKSIGRCGLSHRSTITKSSVNPTVHDVHGTLMISFTYF